MTEKLIRLQMSDDTTESYKIQSITRLDVGGCEGPKYRASLINKKGVLEVMFVKEYEEQDNRSRSCLEAHTVLAKAGIPVPKKLGYYQSENGKDRLVMTDMSDNGVNNIIGFSDNPSPNMEIIRRRLALTEEELRWIQDEARKVAVLATNHGFRFRFYNYHLIVKPSRDFGVFLCDYTRACLTKEGYLGIDNLRRFNIKDMNGFVNYLRSGNQF